jgi:hypothetical protein
MYHVQKVAELRTFDLLLCSDYLFSITQALCFITCFVLCGSDGDTVWDRLNANFLYWVVGYISDTHL